MVLIVETHFRLFVDLMTRSYLAIAATEDCESQKPSCSNGLTKWCPFLYKNELKSITMHFFSIEYKSREPFVLSSASC